jgi:diguanylate cyclase (GGDEF)-like protein/PAS domain S-box-containing protein
MIASNVFLEKSLLESGFYDIFLITLSGDVIYTVKKESDFGANLFDGDLSTSGLATAVKSAMTVYDVSLGDFEYYQPSNKKAAFIAVPVFNDHRQMVGVLAAQIDTQKLYDVFLNAKGLGYSGELYAAKLEHHSIIATTPIRDQIEPSTKEQFIFDARPDSAIYRAVYGESSSGIVDDYQGNKSIAAWGYLPDLEWGVVVHVNLDEILKPIEDLRFYAIILLFFVILGILVAILSSIRNIVRPIEKLALGMQRFSQSKHNEPIDIDVDNEIGDLARNFNDMAKSLKQSQDTIKRYANDLEIKVEQRTQELKLAKDDIEEKSMNMKKYIDLIDKYIITSETDSDGYITDVSIAFCQITGYSKAELLGRKHSLLKHKDTYIGFYEQLWQTIASGSVWRGEIKNTRKDGSDFWVDVIIEPKFHENGSIKGYYAIRQDITDKKIIEEISITDGLTHIYNRRHFNEVFPKMINQAKRHDELLCFLLMDIDYFKQYNDHYGHQMGDDVLVVFANFLKNTLKRADDMPFRLGGEEFGVLFKADTEEKATKFANLLRRNIEALNIPHDYSNVSQYVTASMGLVCKRGVDLREMDELYKEADDLLYVSKQQGRNQVSVNRV